MSTYITVDNQDSSAISVITIDNINTGSGDVTGPSSSTDEAIVRFDGITGKYLQNGIVTITDLGVMKNIIEIWFDSIGDYKFVKNGTALEVWVQGIKVHEWG